MITSKFYIKNHEIIGFHVSGHAGYAEHGSDIICSAVSVLSMSIANGITEVLKIQPEIDIDEDGMLKLSLRKNSEEEISRSEVLLRTMLINMQDLEKNYTDYIKVLIDEEV